MFDTKIPLTLLFAVFLQAVGLVWWVSQQSAAIEGMKEDLVVLTSRAALEDNVNLKREVYDHGRDIEAILESMEEHKNIGNLIAVLSSRIVVNEAKIDDLKQDKSGR